MNPVGREWEITKVTTKHKCFRKNVGYVYYLFYYVKTYEQDLIRFSIEISYNMEVFTYVVT